MTRARRERRDARIVASAQQGARVSLIAAAHSLSRMHVRRILARAGVAPHHSSKPQPERDARIVAAARDGANLAALGREHGLSRARIHQIVHGRVCQR